MARAKTKSRSKPARKKVKAPAKKRRAAAKKSRAKAGDWRIVCDSLQEIRANIDRLDAVIVPLVCQRHYFVTQAAKFKTSVQGVVVPSRVVEIINRVRAMAEGMNSNPDTIEAVYRAMIDAFTADEQRHWAEINARETSR